MRETLKTLVTRLGQSRKLRWFTNPVYDRGLVDGIALGYQEASKLVERVATNAERRRVNDILIRERARLLDLEEMEWKGYSKELLDEVEAIMTLVGKEE